MKCLICSPASGCSTGKSPYNERQRLTLSRKNVSGWNEGILARSKLSELEIFLMNKSKFTGEQIAFALR